MLISSGIFGTTIIDDHHGWECGLNVPVMDDIVAQQISALSAADTELCHSEADRMLCELLDKVGFTKTVAAFKALDKWYA